MPLSSQGPREVELEVVDKDNDIILGHGSLDIAALAWETRSFHMCSVLLKASDMEAGSLNLLFRSPNPAALTEWAKAMDRMQPVSSSPYALPPPSLPIPAPQVPFTISPSSITTAIMRPSEPSSGPMLQVQVSDCRGLPEDQDVDRFVSLSMRETGWSVSTSRIPRDRPFTNEKFSIPLPTIMPPNLGIDIGVHSVDRADNSTLLAHSWLPVEEIPSHMRKFEVPLTHPGQETPVGTLELLARYLDADTSVVADRTIEPSGIMPSTLLLDRSQSYMESQASTLMPFTTSMPTIANSPRQDEYDHGQGTVGMPLIMGMFVVSAVEVILIRSPPDFMDHPSDVCVQIRLLSNRHKAQKRSNFRRFEMAVRWPDQMEFDIFESSTLLEVQLIRRDQHTRDAVLGSCRVELPQYSEERCLKLEMEPTPSFPLVSCNFLIHYRTKYEDPETLKRRQKSSPKEPSAERGMPTRQPEQKSSTVAYYDLPEIQRHAAPPYVNTARAKDGMVRLATTTAPVLMLADKVMSKPPLLGGVLFVVLFGGIMSWFFQLLLLALIAWGGYSKTLQSKSPPKKESEPGEQKTAAQRAKELEAEEAFKKRKKEQQEHLQKAATLAEESVTRVLCGAATVTDWLSWKDPKVSTAVLGALGALLLLSFIIPAWFFALLALLALFACCIRVPDDELKQDAYLQLKPAIIVTALVFLGSILLPVWLMVIVGVGYLVAYAKVPAIRAQPSSALIADSLYAANRMLFGAERNFTGLMKIQVLGAEVKGPGGSSVDPFVVLTAERGQVRYTTVAVDTTTPQWQENWQPLVVTNLTPVRLQVWDNINPIMTNANQDFLGEVYLHINGPIQTGSPQWLPLQLRSGSEQPNRPQPGRVLVSYSITEVQVRVPRQMASKKTVVETTKGNSPSPGTKPPGSYQGLSSGANPTFDKQRTRLAH
eukprot:NODE_49_length_2983_cov_139.511929_g45_i0.p1 GENE.NODE_49_length_2983_cov_139.511929_g45_i0~~NODE_49_length_2983_cov_139.511929_g45_i0.p1  ORF type:complete len:961 (+),score=277.23 NODE_49_length_2983_cov_139.511929_g45_i0:84-2885(+)